MEKIFRVFLVIVVVFFSEVSFTEGKDYNPEHQMIPLNNIYVSWEQDGCNKSTWNLYKEMQEKRTSDQPFVCLMKGNTLNEAFTDMKVFLSSDAKNQTMYYSKDVNELPYWIYIYFFTSGSSPSAIVLKYVEFYDNNILRVYYERRWPVTEDIKVYDAIIPLPRIKKDSSIKIEFVKIHPKRIGVFRVLNEKEKENKL